MNLENGTKICRVVVAGAGPAGLLLVALLLQRNQAENRQLKYDVTLVESRSNLGTLNPETDLHAHRSWMISLSGHGIEALRSVPKLYEDYVANIGVKMEKFQISIGSKKVTFKTAKGAEDFIVDRNYIVAAMSRYAHENFKENQYYRAKYETKLLFVDDENHRVLVREETTQEDEYLPYDLLVGADGIRSTVRETMVKRHFDFNFEISDTFDLFKAVHIKRPESMSGDAILLVPSFFANCGGICLPEMGNMLNVAIGPSRHEFNNTPKELLSEDVKVVAKYFQDNIKVFSLTDADSIDFAEQWINQRWNSAGSVHCNMYHSLPCKLVLLGDAAHATSPSIGMGMNTALRDAQKFNELLDQYDDNLEEVLPQFSKTRVPEGNALSDLSIHLFCFDEKVLARSMLSLVVRISLYKLFPWLVECHPFAYIGNPKWTLSQVYQLATKLGIIQKHRAINNRIRQEYFELETGMVKKETRSCFGYKMMAFVGIVAYGIAAFRR